MKDVGWEGMRLEGRSRRENSELGKVEKRTDVERREGGYRMGGGEGGGGKEGDGKGDRKGDGKGDGKGEGEG